MLDTAKCLQRIHTDSWNLIQGQEKNVFWKIDSRLRKDNFLAFFKLILFSLRDHVRTKTFHHQPVGCAEKQKNTRLHISLCVANLSPISSFSDLLTYKSITDQDFSLMSTSPYETSRRLVRGKWSNATCDWSYGMTCPSRTRYLLDIL